jgi:hypothetical protein
LPQELARDPRANMKSSGAAMNDHSQRDNASPYSALPCVLLLLTTGIAVKLGAAIHVCQLAQGAC